MSLNFLRLCCCVCVPQSVQEADMVLTATSTVTAGTMAPVTVWQESASVSQDSMGISANMVRSKKYRMVLYCHTHITVSGMSCMTSGLFIFYLFLISSLSFWIPWPPLPTCLQLPWQGPVWCQDRSLSLSSGLSWKALWKRWGTVFIGWSSVEVMILHLSCLSSSRVWTRPFWAWLCPCLWLWWRHTMWPCEWKVPVRTRKDGKPLWYKLV